MRILARQSPAPGRMRRLVVDRNILETFQTPPGRTHQAGRFLSWPGLAVSLCLHAVGAVSFALWQEPRIEEFTDSYAVNILPDVYPMEASSAQPGTRTAQAPPSTLILAAPTSGERKRSPWEKALLPPLERMAVAPQTPVEKSADPKPVPPDQTLKAETALPEAASPASPPSLDLVSSNYWESVRAAVARNVRYPSAAVRLGIEGSIDLRLTIDAQGNLVEAAPLARAPDLLIQSALSAVRRAAPFPSNTNRSRSVASATLPIRFQLNKKPERSPSE